MIGVWLLLALALAYGLTRVAAGYPRPLRAFGFLMRGEAAFLKAAAEATFPPAGAIPISGQVPDDRGALEYFCVALSG